MECFKFILCFSTLFLNYVLALQQEGIRNGLVAEEGIFTYQVAILVKGNFTNELNLIGSGTIISENLILSAAQCFIDEDGNLKQYQYSIATNTTNWKDIKGIEALIVLIYFPSGAIHYLDDIAVAKLNRRLNIINNEHLSALEIPSQDESFLKESGLVTGFGYCFVIEEIILDMFEYEVRKRLLARSDNQLRYARVLVTSNTNCSSRSPAINIDKQFCGLMKSLQPLGAGICDDDSGSPLVIDNKVIGIAGFHYFDCDDSRIGNAYTKVSYYAPFIKSIINEDPLPDVFIRYNRNHVHTRAAAAAA